MIKDYLMNTPLLIPPNPSRPLLLYISATNTTLGVLLAHHNAKGKECVVYYISRTLADYELNYTPIERVCLTIILVATTLRHYMLTHKVQLIAKIDPLKYLLSKAALIGRLAKWVMILSEFDIEYVDHKAIKGHVIVDQLANTPLKGDHPLISNFLDEEIFMITTTQPWKLYFDGSYTRDGSRTSILSITPQGDIIPKSYRLTFPCTNNIAEYEVLITGLRLAKQ